MVPAQHSHRPRAARPRSLIPPGWAANLGRDRRVAHACMFEARRAVGVRVRQRGETRIARAEGDGDLAGGAITPAILPAFGWRAGGGATSHGINVVADLRVGRTFRTLCDRGTLPPKARHNTSTRGVAVSRSKEAAKYLLPARPATLSPAHIASSAASRARGWPDRTSSSIALPATSTRRAIEQKMVLERNLG